MEGILQSRQHIVQGLCQFGQLNRHCLHLQSMTELLGRDHLCLFAHGAQWRQAAPGD